MFPLLFTPRDSFVRAFVLNKSSNFPQTIHSETLEKKEEEMVEEGSGKKKKSGINALSSPVLPLHKFVSMCITHVVQCPVFQ